MKLLTPEVGWAATGQELYWTTDGGAQWRDITPKLQHKSQEVSSVFFLDSSTGWALLHCGDDRNPKIDDTCFEFASTTDAGQSWSIVHPRIVDPASSHIEDGLGFSGRTFLGFTDPQHGWAVLKINWSTLSSSGEMLRTVDGGRTWTQLTKGDLPMAEHFHFVTANFGWMAGGPDHVLYVTRDAGDSWQLVTLPKPSEVGPDHGIFYELPVFENERRGFLPVRYEVGPEMGPDMTTVVLFATGDGGRTWKQDRISSRLPDIYSSDVAKSMLIAVHSEIDKEHQDGSQYSIARTKLSLYTLGPDRNATNNTADIPSRGAATQLSFLNRDYGWVNMSDRIFATQDAGISWVDVSPGGARRLQPSIHQSPKTIPLQKQVGSAGNTTQQSTTGNNSSMQLGFDAYNSPTVPQMQAWMNSSPYYVFNVYLPGSLNGHKDNNLTPVWVSAVQTQGWGLIPTWVGLQSPCACAKTVKGVCTPYAHVFSSDPSADGANEADQAITASKNLGLVTTILYKDIENYTPSTS